MAETSHEDAIVQRLNILILLGLDALGRGGETSVRSKVDRLLNMGLEPAQVASIIGKPVSHVTSITSKARKAAQRKDNHHG